MTTKKSTSLIKRFVNPDSIQLFFLLSGIFLWAYISDSSLMTETLIGLNQILLAGCFVAILSTSITLWLGKKHQLQGHLWIHLFYGVVFTNAFFWFVVLTVNFHFHKDEKRLSLPILERGQLGSPKHDRRNKYAKVVIDGNDTKISYPPETDLDSIQKIDLTIAKGLFGYKVILDKRIK